VPALDADLEVISLLTEALGALGIEQLCMDLGHVGIYRSIEESLDLAPGLKAELFALVQAKSCELDAWVATHIGDPALAAMLRKLPTLVGDSGVLDLARELFAQAPAEVELALDELQLVVDTLGARYPGLRIYLDLCELEGYHYHTGIVFAAYAEAARQALGNGGRYDDIGESFGRARPATGFSIDLKAVAALVAAGDGERQGVYAPPSDDPVQASAVRELRARGERVVCGFDGQAPDPAELGCDRLLVVDGQAYTLQPLHNESQS